MNNLLFTAITLALLWYFLYYLPQQKKNTRSSFQPQPTFQHQSTQTDPLTYEYEPGLSAIPDPEEIKKLEKDISQKEQTIIGLNNSYTKLEQKTQKELDNLKKQLTKKDEEITELKSVEKSLDDMIKNIQELNKQID